MAPTATNPRINALLERSSKKAEDPTAYSFSLPLSFFSYDQRLPATSAPVPTPSSSHKGDESAKVNNKMDWISEKMENLILSMWTTQPAT